MSRKHYVEVAEIIKYRLDRAQSTDEHMGIKGVAEDLAGFFKRDNGGFDRLRFMEACGL
jgi:hypothetical protein